MGVSADPPDVLATFVRRNAVKHMLLSDTRRQMLAAWGAMVTDAKSPLYRSAKRAYFIVDRRGVLRWQRIQDDPLNLLDPEEVLRALTRVGS